MGDPPSPTDDPELERAGLCAQCRHVHRIETARGSRFYLCNLAETDPCFARYPNLPVRSCAGHAPAAPPAGSRERPGVSPEIEGRLLRRAGLSGRRR